MLHVLVSLVAQVADTAQQITHTAVTAGTDSNEVKPFLITAGLIFWIMDALKTKKWYRDFIHAFPGADKWAHRFVAGAGSVITGLGIHWTYNGSLLAGGVLTVQQPPLQQIITSVWHVGSDTGGIYVLQQLIYMMAHRDVNTMAGHVDLQPIDVQGLPPAAKQ